jgi:Ca2+-transporting ATPase
MGMPEPDLRALVFTSLVLINMGLILVNRSFESSLFRAILQPNRALWILLGSVSVLLAIAVFWQPAQSLFHFGRLHWDDLAACGAVGVASLIALEALKSKWFRVAVANNKLAAPKRG